MHIRLLLMKSQLTRERRNLKPHVKCLPLAAGMLPPGCQPLLVTLDGGLGSWSCVQLRRRNV